MYEMVESQRWRKVMYDDVDVVARMIEDREVR